MAHSVKTTMAHMPRRIDELESIGFRWSHFTVGGGKAKYKLWTCGTSGLHYCYRVDDDGHPCGRRAVEPDKEVFIHFK